MVGLAINWRTFAVILNEPVNNTRRSQHQKLLQSSNFASLEYNLVCGAIEDYRDQTIHWR